MKSTYNAQEEINDLRQTLVELDARLDVVDATVKQMSERLDKLDKSLEEITRALGTLAKNFNTSQMESASGKRIGSIADRSKVVSQVAPTINDIFNRYYKDTGGAK